MKIHIAYVDDSSAHLERISANFSREFFVETFLDPDKFLQSFDTISYSAILLDIFMPKISGFELYEKIVDHPDYNGCPIMFISGDDTETAKLKSFELGAVDFMGRMVAPDEMLARLRSKIQFYQKHRHITEFDGLKINRTLLKTYVNGNEVALTFIELKLLCLVLRNYPDVVLKEQVIEHIWRAGHNLDGTVYTHLSNLNNKLRDWDYEILSVRRQGIQLVKRGEGK